MTDNTPAPLTTADLDLNAAGPNPGPQAVDQLMQHAQAMSTAQKLAEAMCGTDLVPETYKGKPGNGAAAILYGAELGLTPIQSLQQIFVVYGVPTIYARTMAALVKTHGYTLETVETSDTSVTVRGTAPNGVTETATWTVERAKKAGYTTNKKYQTDPQAMLYAKAVTEVCRKLAPDVLLGIAYSREEIELERPVRVESHRTDRPSKGNAAARQALGIFDGPGDNRAPGPPETDGDDQPAAAENSTPAATKAELDELKRELDAANIATNERQSYLSSIAQRPLSGIAEMTSREVADAIEMTTTGELPVRD